MAVVVMAASQVGPLLLCRRQRHVSECLGLSQAAVGVGCQPQTVALSKDRHGATLHMHLPLLGTGATRIHAAKGMTRTVGCDPAVRPRLALS